MTLVVRLWLDSAEIKLHRLGLNPCETRLPMALKVKRLVRFSSLNDIEGAGS